MRGRFYLFVVICFAILALTFQSDNSCSKKNPFLELIKITTFKPIEIYKSPVKDISIDHCKYEWDEFGTCCNQEQLVAANQREVEEIETNRGKLDEVTKEIKEAASRILAWLEDHSSVKGSEILYESVSKYVTLDAHDLIGNSSKKCWDYMSRMRASALCSICSGRSEQYFNKSKILISPDTCSSSVAECEGFFRDYDNIMRGFLKIQSSFKLLTKNIQINKSLANLAKKIRAISPPEKLRIAFRTLRESTFIQDMKQKRSEKKAKNNDLQSKENEPYLKTESLKFLKLKSLICSMILNVRHVPLVTAIDPGKLKAEFKVTINQLKEELSQTLLELNKAAEERLKEATGKHLRLLREIKKEKQEKIAEIKENPNHYLKQLTSTVKPFNKQLAGENKRYFKERKSINQEFDGKIKKVRKEFDNKIKNVSKEYKAHLKSLKDRTLGLKIATASSRSLWLSSGSLSSVDYFTSDAQVFLAQQDNMFHSYDGAQGTTLVASTQPYIPMNITMAFP